MTPVEVSLCAQPMTSAPGSAAGSGASPGSACSSDRVGEKRRALGDRRELARELAVDERERALADEAEGGGVPERGRAAVAERDLVAVGRAEQLGDAGADAADERLDGLLAVRRAHEAARTRSARLVELVGADLRGAASEAAVGRSEVLGNLEQGARRHGNGPRSVCGGQD